MNKFDRVEFEETRFWELQDEFIDKNTDLWNKFVDDKYQEYLEQFVDIKELEVEDYLLEQRREEDEL